MIDPITAVLVILAVGGVIAVVVWAITRPIPGMVDPDRGLPAPTAYPPMPKVAAPKPIVATSQPQLMKKPKPVAGNMYGSGGTGGGSTTTATRTVREGDRVYVNQYDNSGDIATSMLIAQATDNAMLGYVAGGSLTGALIGAALNNHSEPTPAYVAPSYAPEPESVREVYRAPDPEPSYVAPSKSYDFSTRDDDSWSRSSSSSSSSWSSDGGSSWSSSDSGSSWSSND